MCTVIVFNHIIPDIPVLLAANRDEFYERPSSGALLLQDNPKIVGGRDEIGGGTWMGVTEYGFFVALTNQRGPSDPTLKSRGAVVMEALNAGSTSAVQDYLRTLDPREYNPFNLMYGDVHSIRVAYARRDATRMEGHPVPQGIHILPNDILNCPEYPKVDRGIGLATPLLSLEKPDLLAAIPDLLADHDRPSLVETPDPPEGSSLTREMVRELQALCVHLPGYGTRSYSIVGLEDGGVTDYLFADGSPCTNKPHDVLPLLRS